DMLGRALDVLRQVPGHEISSLHLFSPDRRELRLCGDRGFSNPLREVNERLPAGEGLIGRVAAYGQSVVLDNVTTSPYLLPAARRVVELEGIRGFVSVPIRGHR